MPNEKPKPKASTLRAILTGVKAILGETAGAPGVAKTAQRAAGQFALNRMAENLDPFNYSEYRRSWLDRGIDAIIKNKKEEERAGAEQFIEKGYGSYPDPTFKSRIDLLQMLAGKKQKYGSITESKYRPTIGEEKGSKYYSSKEIEDEIISNLGLEDKQIKWQKDIADIISERALLDERGRKKISGRIVSAIIPGLREAGYSVGKDDKGVYLAYSDKWDIDPREGFYKDEKKAALSTLESVMNWGSGLGIEAMKAASTPTKVYGRIYFDPKTGKPIR